MLNISYVKRAANRYCVVFRILLDLLAHTGTLAKGGKLTNHLKSDFIRIIIERQLSSKLTNYLKSDLIRIIIIRQLLVHLIVRAQ